MSNEETIFAEALQKTSASDRDTYLIHACGGNAKLRSQVEALLRAHDRAAGVLEGSPLGGIASETVGSTIGPYKLLEQIGGGGMGVVYMAEQIHPVRRKVALKIIKPGMDSGQVIARFEAERQALTMMEHPNIARVLDAGTTDAGRPYFVMELVKGIPITDYCDQARLSTRERLDLFMTVCHAVQHAHQKGIIHRDLKPTNVLVTLHDDKPVPKVIDFGIAKAAGQTLTDKTLFTNYAQMLGTPLYMSPEQAQISGLDVDTRSDVYSLGVLLYELLTGTTPFDKNRLRAAAYDEMRRIIREEDPPNPSTRLSTMGEKLTAISVHRHTDPKHLNQLVRGELDWIVMKALEKDRSRRYETANGLAHDVERHLRDEAVQACPPSAAYRFRKFARRHKRALATVLTLGVATLVALGAMAGSIGWVVRDRQTRLTTTASQVGRIIAETEELHRQGKLPEAVLAAQTAQRLLDSGGGSDDLRLRVHEWLIDLDTVAKLEAIRFEYDMPRISASCAETFRRYGIDVEALPPSEAARRIATRQIRVDLALALELWASREQQLRNKDAAHIQRLLEIAAAADPDPLRKRLREATARKDLPALRKLAGSADLDTLPVPTVHSISVALESAGDATAGLAFLRKVQQRHPGDFTVNSALAIRMIKGGVTRADDAVSYARAAVAIRPRSAAAHSTLGRALAWSGVERGKSGRQEAEEAVAACREGVRLDPNYAFAHCDLGYALWKNGQNDAAIIAFREAIRLQPDFEGAHSVLSVMLVNKGLVDDAIAECREAIRINPQYAHAYTNLGSALVRKGMLDEAIAAHRHAIHLEPTSAYAHTNFAVALWKKGLLDDAVAACRESLRLNWPGAEIRGLNGMALNNVAWDLATSPDVKMRDPARAVQLAKEAVALAPEGVAFWNTLGAAQYRAGDWKAAVEALEKSMKLRGQGTGSDFCFLAMSHWQLGNKEAARKWYDQAVQWKESDAARSAQHDRFRAEAAELLGLEGKRTDGRSGR